MKSFKDRLVITNNLKLIESCIRQAQEINIKPEVFVSIFCESLQDCLDEGIWDNISSRYSQGARSGTERQHNSPFFQRMGDKFGNFIQKNADRLHSGMGKVKNAYDSFSSGIGGANQSAYTTPATSPPKQNDNNSVKSALSDLSKRINTSPELQSLISDKNFSQSLINLITMIKDHKENLTLKKDYYYIENCLEELNQIGLDINDLVDFYIKENFVVEEGVKDWFSKAGNWLSGQWSNLKGAIKNWNKPNIERSKNLDKQVVQKALGELIKLSKSGENVTQDFKQLLQHVYNHLEDLNKKLDSKTFSADTGMPPTGSKSIDTGKPAMSGNQSTRSYSGSSVVPKTTGGKRVLDKKGNLTMPKSFGNVSGDTWSNPSGYGSSQFDVGY